VIGGVDLKLKSFIIAFTALFVTTGALYLIGHLFTIPWLMFHHEYISNEDGFKFTTTGSLIPLVIGCVASFVAEKIYMYSYRQKLG
jgi:hypothetical protein